jgi:hypothetical protein
LIDLARRRAAPKTIHPRSMQITDLTHFLDKSGAIGPVKGPALAMAQFQVDVVAHASDAAPQRLPCAEVLQVQEGRCRGNASS